MPEKQWMLEEIRRMKNDMNALILAHYYQTGDVQDLADVLGDSLDLSRKAADSSADVIVFCGVQFMGETAKILSPEKTILMPRPDAGCLMADMAGVEEAERLRREYPGAALVAYVNTTAEVKARVDYCCTSANAVNLCRQIPEQEIASLPDRNLGQFVASQVPEKTFHMADGFCPTHHFVEPQEVHEARARWPEAEILAHPECTPEVLALVDFVGSTSRILERARVSPARQLVICTERGILHPLKKASPEKEFLVLSPRLICPNMKKNGVEDVYLALKNRQYAVEVPEDIRTAAYRSLERMLEYA